MNPNKNTVKTRLILGIADQVIQRPRELQQVAGTAEHHVVHELYSLQKQGLVEYKIKRNVHSPGRNLTSIKLTPKGTAVYKRMIK